MVLNIHSFGSKNSPNESQSISQTRLDYMCTCLRRIIQDLYKVGSLKKCALAAAQEQLRSLGHSSHTGHEDLNLFEPPALQSQHPRCPFRGEPAETPSDQTEPGNIFMACQRYRTTLATSSSRVPPGSASSRAPRRAQWRAAAKASVKVAKEVRFTELAWGANELERPGSDLDSEIHRNPRAGRSRNERIESLD